MKVKRMIRPLPWLFSVLLAGAVQASTELELAAKAGRLAEVQALLEAGADVNGVDGDSVWERTPLMVAVQGGHLAVVRHLLAKGADPAREGDATGSSPLRKAAYKGRIEIVEVLLAAGAAPDFDTDEYGRSPLVWALISDEANTAAVVEALLQAGAKRDAVLENPLTGEKKPAALLAREAGPAVEAVFNKYVTP